MKKTINLLCCALVLSLGAFAQISLGPAGGAYITRYVFRPHQIGASSRDDKMVVDFKLGALANIQLDPHWHLQPGLFYAGHGYKNQKGSTGVVNKFRIYAAEIPVILTYKTLQKNGGHFFFGAGPYLGVNTNGTAHVIYTDYLGNYTGENDVPIYIGKKWGGIRRFAGGAVANIGYELKNGFSVRGHFQTSIISLSPGASLMQGITNYNYGLTFAYMFPPKKDAKEKKK